jgi:hypothetical protein
MKSRKNETIECNVLLYTDEQWKLALEAKTCKEKESLSESRMKVSIPLNEDYWFTKPVTSNLFFPWETAYVFIAVSDCDEKTHMQDKNLPKIILSISLMNGKSHSSHEEAYLKEIYMFCTLFCVVLLGGHWWSQAMAIKRGATLPVGPMRYIFFAEIFQCFGLFLHYLDMYSYARNGRGILVLDFFGMIFSVFSQSTVAVLLICFAWGWTITFTSMEKGPVSFDKDGKMLPPPDHEEMNLFVFGIFLVFIGHGATGTLTYINSAGYTKFHPYQGWQGVVYVAFRLALYVYFMKELSETKKMARLRSQKFVNWLMVIATIYFLSLPITIAVAQM